MSSAQLFDLNDRGEAVGGIGRWRWNADGYFEGINTPPCTWDSTNGFVALPSLYDEATGFYFTPRAINNRGQILAIIGDVMAIHSENGDSDFIRFPNTFNPYGYYPWLGFDATDLSDNGDVAITAGQPYEYLPKQAMVYRSATGALVPLSQTISDSQKVSENGLVAGHIYPDSGPSKAVIWPDEVPLASGYSSFVVDMNATGSVCGLYLPGPNSGYKPYVSRVNPETGVRTFHRLPLLDTYNQGSAEVINDNGLIMGYMWSGNTSIYVQWILKKNGVYRAESLQQSFEAVLPGLYNQTGPSAGLGPSLRALNNRGQVLLTAIGSPYESLIGYSVLLTPRLLEIAVDANRDGTTRFSNDPDVKDTPTLSDSTSTQKPFLFWINDDWDSSGSEKIPKDPNATPNDSADGLIKSARDLEDFSRLAIQLTPELKAKLRTGYHFRAEVRGALRINLFPAAPGIQEGNYLSDPEVAAAQIKGRFRTALAPTVDFLPTAADYERGSMFLLWEGSGVGKGELVVKLLTPDGAVETLDTVHVELHSVRDYFDHVQMTPVDGFKPPYATKGQVPPIGWEYAHSRTLPTSPDEEKNLVVFVHGWRVSPSERQNWSEMFFKRLWHAGYKGRYASFTWPTYSGDPTAFTTYNRSEFRAWKAGSALADYLKQIRLANPTGTTINVAAHSMGNVLVAEALSQDTPIDNYVMMQAALSSSCWDSREELFVPSLFTREPLSPTPDMDNLGGYRGYLSRVRGVNVMNFYNEQDFALRTGADITGGQQPVGLWEANNMFFKPQAVQGLFINRLYRFDEGFPGIYRVFGEFPIWTFRLQRELKDQHESMAFLARSRTRAAGGEPRTGFVGNQAIPGQQIQGRVDLFARYGMDDNISEHSAEFNRSIQEQMVPFYRQLGVSLKVIK